MWLGLLASVHLSVVEKFQPRKKERRISLRASGCFFQVFHKASTAEKSHYCIFACCVKKHARSNQVIQPASRVNLEVGSSTHLLSI